METSVTPCASCLHHQDRKSIDDVSDKCFPCVWQNSQTGYWPNYEAVEVVSVRDWEAYSEDATNWQGYTAIKTVTKDNVNSPSHYTQGGIETIDYIKAKLGKEGCINYCMGNVMKYTSRWQDKNGLEDLKKAQWYLNYAINLMKD